MRAFRGFAQKTDMLNYLSMSTLALVVRTIVYNCCPDVISFGKNYPFFITEITDWSNVLECTIRCKLDGLKSNQTIFNQCFCSFIRESPQLFSIFAVLHRVFGDYILLVFTFTDLVTAFLLCKSFSLLEIDRLLVDNSNHVNKVKTEETMMLYSYLFNPCTIISCCVLSTGSVHNLLLVLSVYLFLSGNKFMCYAITSFISIFEIYPIILIPIFVAHFSNKMHHSILKDFLLIAIMSITHICVGRALSGTWSFLSSTAGCILSYCDNKPNIGMWWYIMVEAFSEFKLMETVVLHSAVLFMHIIPLSVKLRNNKHDALLLSLFIICAFKPYPSMSDFALQIAFFLMRPEWFKDSNWTNLIVALYTVGIVLMSALWNGYAIRKVFNSNFYFVGTTTFSFAQVIMLEQITKSIKIKGDPEKEKID
ncbi:hypothetical protein GJ496_000286 [Pomphorhynchus laevis]|nr:hypothetical protein GJ496_000286 [Pomphorhynchus laevis]